MKKYLWDYGYLLGIAAIIVAFDQWTKYLVRANLGITEQWAPWPWLLQYARIVHWKNTGAAFGMFQDSNQIFTVLAILVTGAILYYFPRVPQGDWPLRLAMGLQLGGALGNLVDRLHQGFVTDFVSVLTFPVFNVADASISVGVVVLVVGVWIKELQDKARLEQAAGEQAAATGPAETEPTEPAEEFSDPIDNDEVRSQISESELTPGGLPQEQPCD